MTAAWLTDDMPHWLALLFIAVAVAAYLACGVLTLISRHRRTTPRRHPDQRPVLVSAGARREVTS